MSDENKKGRDQNRFSGGEGDRSTLGSRARNRTVLLTPETIGQMRASLTGEGADPNADPVAELLPPLNWDYPEGQPPAAGGEPQEPAPEAEHEAFAPRRNNVEEQRPILEGAGRRPMGRFGVPAGAARERTSNDAFEQPPAGGFQSAAARGGKPAPERRPAAPEPVEAPRRAPARAAARSKLIGFLISYDQEQNGEVFELRVGRWLVTSRPTDTGDYILVEDESVSPLHAILRATQDGKLQLLDQLSEFGTAVFRTTATEEEEVAGAMAVLNHGDMVRFGKRWFVVCLVPIREKPAGQEEKK